MLFVVPSGDAPELLVSVEEPLDEMALLSEPFVGQQHIAFSQGLVQGLGFGAVGNLAAGQAQEDGAALRIDEGMDFAGETAAGTSHATIVSSPLFPVAAC